MHCRTNNVRCRNDAGGDARRCRGGLRRRQRENWRLTCVTMRAMTKIMTGRNDAMEERRGERGNGTKGAGQASNAKPASTRNTTSHMMLVQRAGLPLCASILRPVSPENIMMRQAKISPHNYLSLSHASRARRQMRLFHVDATARFPAKCTGCNLGFCSKTG
jgi:hypothetical protein